MDSEKVFKKSEFIPTSTSSISIDEASRSLHRKTSIDKMIQTHNEILIKFFEILKEMEDENKKKNNKCCGIQ